MSNSNIIPSGSIGVSLGFLLVVYENLNYTRIWGLYKNIGDFCWRVSDCEELVVQKLCILIFTTNKNLLPLILPPKNTGSKRIV